MTAGKEERIPGEGRGALREDVAVAASLCRGVSCPGSTRASRVGDDALAITNFLNSLTTDDTDLTD